jgi:hypothetical protein
MWWKLLIILDRKIAFSLYLVLLLVSVSTLPNKLHSSEPVGLTKYFLKKKKNKERKEKTSLMILKLYRLKSVEVNMIWMPFIEHSSSSYLPGARHEILVLSKLYPSLYSTYKCIHRIERGKIILWCSYQYNQSYAPTNRKLLQKPLKTGYTCHRSGFLQNDVQQLSDG